MRSGRATSVPARKGAPGLKPQAGQARGFAESDGFGTVDPRPSRGTGHQRQSHTRDEGEVSPSRLGWGDSLHRPPTSLVCKNETAFALGTEWSNGRTKGLPAWISCNSLAIRGGVERATQSQSRKWKKPSQEFRSGAEPFDRSATAMAGQFCQHSALKPSRPSRAVEPWPLNPGITASAATVAARRPRASQSA
jgi:hypothetical protein